MNILYIFFLYLGILFINVVLLFYIIKKKKICINIFIKVVFFLL